MSNKKKEYYGADVAEAIAGACSDLNLPLEEINIEVIETGSSGIFGLCRKKARIRAQARKAGASEKDERRNSPRVESNCNEPPLPPAAPEQAQTKKTAVKPERGKEKAKKEPAKKSGKPAPKAPRKSNGTADAPSAKKQGKSEKQDERQQEQAVIEEEHLQLVRENLEEILRLMNMSSTVTSTGSEGKILCRITGEHEEKIIADNARILDSLQYLLRKMLSRHLPRRTALTVDAGNYRETRHEELHDKALELADLVRENGRTQSIPALNPSERRTVHISLQDDDKIRSRSVGEGLFKKVLIYKPGKGKGRGAKPRKKQTRRPAKKRSSE